MTRAVNEYRVELISWQTGKLILKCWNVTFTDPVHNVFKPGHPIMCKGYRNGTLGKMG